MNMRWTLSDIAKMVDGQVLGDGTKVIAGTAGFETAGNDEITYAGSAAYVKQISGSAAGAVLVPRDVAPSDKNLVLVDNPRIAFNRLSLMFAPKDAPVSGDAASRHVGENFVCGKDGIFGPFVTIGDDVCMGNRVKIHANVFIGNQVTLGDDVEIFPNVTLLNGCKIGNRVIIKAGSVIGSDGFGFELSENGYVKIHHTGIVQIDDDVEIGALTTVDRGTNGRTWIKKGAKTDNLVHIGHNVVVGENTLLVAQVGISGSTAVGDNVILAGKVGVAGHLTIGDNVTVGPKGGVAKSIPAGETVSGYPTMPHKVWARASLIVPTLPDLKKKIAKLEKQVSQLLENEKKDQT